MTRKLKISGVALGIAAIVSVIVLLILHDSNPRSDYNQFPKEIGKTPLGAQDPLSNQFVNELKKYYGKSISDKVTQAGLLDIRNSILRSHPDKGKAMFYAMLKMAFPDQADEIMNTLDKLDQYDLWLKENKTMLSQMTATQRLAALEKKRRELFGGDAEKIWTGEQLATEARKAKVQDTLAYLNNSDNTTMDEKVEVYQGTLREAYEGTPEKFILDQDHLLTKVFFSIDSVQDELKQMSPDQRQLEINRIRKKMGFTEQQVDKMAKRDADNELRWEAGLQYMKEREVVVQQYNGPELEEKLKTLREQYFDDEAKTIELEEKGDFYRFKRPHIYGRN